MTIERLKDDEVMLAAVTKRFDVADSATQIVQALVIVVAVGLQRSGRTS